MRGGADEDGFQPLSREELIEAVQLLLDGGLATEEEGDALLDRIERSVPHPRVSGLIFWAEREMTAEEIVDAAFAYRPIEL